MPKTAVIIGCIDGTLASSDRAATTLAVNRFGEDLVLCVPHGEPVALRYAVGAGANDVVPIDGCNALVYIVGRGGAGIDGDRWAAQLATAEKATLILDVLDVEVWGDGVRVQRDLGRGVREELTVSGPVVLVVADDAPQRMYVSRFRQFTALPPPVEPAPIPPINWQPVRLRAKIADSTHRRTGAARDRMFEVFGLDDAGAKREEQIIVADSERCAEYLLRYLAHHGFVDRRLDTANLSEELSKFRKSVATVADTDVTPPTTPIGRAPRPVAGLVGNLHRRPRPYRPVGPSSKLLRRPRPYGHTQRSRVRGPFPVCTTKGETND